MLRLSCALLATVRQVFAVETESCVTMRGGRLRQLLRIIASVSSLAVAGCSTLDQVLDRLPESLVASATVGEYRNIRFYSDDTKSLHAIAEDRIREVRRLYAGRSLVGRVVDLNYLSISGGGGDGAFGVGLLGGWSALGTRPKFDVVTGISTGALIAPFAFLGSAYDGIVKQAYTTTSTDEVASMQPVQAVLGFTSSLSSNVAFQSLIARYVTPAILTAIADEYRKGRMLLIGTTNLDAQRPVIWDIGAIAASGRPDALELTRMIIMASASIPGVFPPVRIKVTADGKFYDELHVDGGVTRQVFLFPPGYDPKIVDAVIKWKPRRRAYIIRNGKIGAQFEAVEAALLPITSRSIETLIKTQGIGDLYRIYLVCRDYNIDYNVAYIPIEFQNVSKTMFDPIYMTALFDLGYQQGSNGYRWRKDPPGF
jgi:hypothetical protein